MGAPDEEAEGGGVAEALEGVRRLYEASLADHGLSSRGVGWKDAASQRLRFEKLAEVLRRGEGGGPVTVNDLGCGYGAMFSYLASLPSVELALYRGYDISEKMLAAARRAVADPRASFVRSARATEEADYSFVSGTFNVKLDAGDELWAEHVKGQLLNLAEKSRRGFAFNLFSTYVDWRQANLYYADPFMYFDFCKRNISPYVSLLHDYPLFEWTMIVHKGPGAASDHEAGGVASQGGAR